MRIVELQEVISTNTWAKENMTAIQSPVMVYAIRQSGGRGQRGNSWESEPGKNLTASFILAPETLAATDQFLLSESLALAAVDLLDDFEIKAFVKWPNDIYVADKKIGGILIENSILGNRLVNSVAGIGLNVNQHRFFSDAPNPVSMAQLTGREYDIKKIASLLSEKFEKRLAILFSGKTHHEEFLKKLWRHDNKFYDFYDKNKECGIKAKIKDVAPSGIMTLELKDKECRDYAFKEIEFIISRRETLSD